MKVLPLLSKEISTILLENQDKFPPIKTFNESYIMCRNSLDLSKPHSAALAIGYSCIIDPALSLYERITAAKEKF